MGLLRILGWAKGDKTVNEIIERGLEAEHLDCFELYYWAYATKSALLNENWESDKIRITLKNLKAPTCEDNVKGSWESFVDEIENILKSFGEGDKVEEIRGFGYARKFLQKFYFNKGVVANPSPSDRLGDFKERYINPVLDILNGNIPQSGENFNCVFCGKSYPIIKGWEKILRFEESDFSPLGVSPKSFSNYFYKGQAPYKCPICQLLLLTAFAGFNRKPWIVSSTDKTDYIFIDQPDIQEAYRVNEGFESFIWNKETGALSDNIYFKGLEMVIGFVGKKSKWVLDNVLFVELKTTSRKDQARPHFVYFNIDKPFAEVFGYLKEKNLYNKIAKVLDVIYDYNDTRINLGVEVIKRLINKQPLKPLIFEYFKDVLGKNKNWYTLFWMVFLDGIISEKRRYKGMKPEALAKYLFALKKSGEDFKDMPRDKRLQLAQRFLSLIRGGRKEDFYNELLRLYVISKREIPEPVFGILTEDNPLSFQEKALAFLSGFISEEVKNENEGINDNIHS